MNSHVTERWREQLIPFYVGGETIVTELRRPIGSDVDGVVERSLPISRTLPSVDPVERAKVLDYVARSAQVVAYGGSTHEILYHPALGGEPGAPTMLSCSTYSSASDNPGNVSEFADRVVLNPNFAHAYWASPGNGGTSPINDEGGQWQDFKRTGRLTRTGDKGTEPVLAIKNLNLALLKAGITTIRLVGTDSAGGAYATALGIGMEPGQLESACFSERSGFVHLGRSQIIGGIAVKEQFLYAATNQKVSVDPERMTKERADEAAVAMAKHAKLPNRMALAAARVGLRAKLRSMYGSMEALRMGPHDGQNPLLAEADALHAQHPGSNITYMMSEHDPLYVNPQTAQLAARHFMAALAESSTDVRLIMRPGSHALNTHWPQFYNELQHRALVLDTK